MKKNSKIEVLNQQINIRKHYNQEYICITDIARHKRVEHTDDLIRNWLRNRNTIEFLGIWEQLNNPDFNYVEFDRFKKQAGLNSFTLTPKQWINRTGAKGIISKAGRYGKSQCRFYRRRTIPAGTPEKIKCHRHFSNADSIDG